MRGAMDAILDTYQGSFIYRGLAHIGTDARGREVYREYDNFTGLLEKGVEEYIDGALDGKISIPALLAQYGMTPDEEKYKMMWEQNERHLERVLGLADKMADAIKESGKVNQNISIPIHHDQTTVVTQNTTTTLTVDIKKRKRKSRAERSLDFAGRYGR